MRFLVMHKLDEKLERGEVDPSVIARMGALIQESIAKGVFTNGAGLKPSHTRTRLRFKGGTCEVTEGPYPGTNELVEGFALMKVADKAEAIRWTKRFAAIVGDMDIELGPINEPWDIGVMPKPEGKLPVRYLSLMMATPASEAGTPPSEREMREMGALIQEMVQAGVLEATEGILPSREGTRLQFKAGKQVSAVDGPFAESKELISGFSVINVPTKADALAWAERYGSILGDLEVDVRKLYDEPAYQKKEASTGARGEVE